MIETLIPFAASTLGSYFAKKGMDTLIASFETKLEDALYKVILETVEDYEQRYAIPDQDKKFPFYQSQRIITELLSFSAMHSDEYDLNEVLLTFQNEPNVIPPSIQDIERFHAIFISKVNEHPDLKKLEIKAKSQDEIYRISKKIDTLKNELESLIMSVNADVELQWKDRIQAYITTLQAFKPTTALQLLDALSNSFSTGTKQPSPALLAEIESQRGLCYRLLLNRDEAYKAQIKAYKKHESNTIYKQRAAIAYFRIGETDKAMELANSLLQDDEFDPHAWAVKALSADSIQLLDVLDQIPSFLKKDAIFQNLVYSILSFNGKNDHLAVLHDKGIVPSFKDYKEKPVNVQTYFEHNFWITVATNEYLRQHFFSFTNAKEPQMELVVFLNKLISRYLIALDGSELNKDQHDIHFMYAYTNYVISGEGKYALEMKDILSKLNNPNFAFKLMCVTALQITGNEQVAIDTIDGFKDKEPELILLKAFCNRRLGKMDEHAATIKDLTSSVLTVNDQIILGYVNSLLDLKVDNHLQGFTGSDFLSNKTFSNPLYHELTKEISELLIDGNSPEGVERLKILCSKFDDPRLKSMTVSALHLAGENEAAIELFRTFIDLEHESRDLYFYIHSLHSLGNSHDELLALFEKWRINFSFIPNFFRAEVQAQRQLLNAKKCIEICEFYKEHEPLDEFMTMHYIWALHNEGSKESIDKIKANVHMFLDFEYSDHGNIRTVGNILIAHKLFHDGIELYYRYAVNEANKNLRMAYFIALSETAVGEKELWPAQEYDVVTEGCFVKYTINNQVKFVELNAENLKNPFNQKFIGCRIHGGYTVTRPMSKEEDLITISRIMNKYLYLHDQILEEVHNNPYSGIPMESITFESFDMDSIHDKLQQMMGESGSQEKRAQENELAKYYNFESTFNEVIHTVYRGDYLAGYFDLAKNREGINCLPMINFSESGDAEYLIDYTSLAIFYQFYLQQSTSFPVKFIISKYIVEDIKRKLAEQEKLTQPEITISVTNEAVVPNLRPENARENNIQYLKGLLEWVDQNCIQEVTSRVLDVTNNMNVVGKEKAFIDYLLNTSLLLEESDKRILVTDDIFYLKVGIHIKKIVSSEFFAKSNLDKDSPAFQEFVKNQYRGYTFTLEQLNTEFHKKATGEFNHYHFCIENISILINPSNLLPAVQHVVWLSEHTDLGEEQLATEITAIFVNLFKGLSEPGLIEKAKQLIAIQFHGYRKNAELVKESLRKAFQVIGLQ